MQAGRSHACRLVEQGINDGEQSRAWSRGKGMVAGGMASGGGKGAMRSGSFALDPCMS